MPDNFIETRKRGPNGKGRVRIRADAITGLVETFVVEGVKDNIRVMRVHLGSNGFLDLEDETMDTLWNKLNQAIGRKLVVVEDTSPEYPGHPVYEQTEKERRGRGTGELSVGVEVGEPQSVMEGAFPVPKAARR